LVPYPSGPFFMVPDLSSEWHAWRVPEDSEPYLREELARTFPGVSVWAPAPGFLAIPARAVSGPPPILAFAQQTLPGAEIREVPSIRSAAEFLVERMLEQWPDEAPWRLHVASCYGGDGAGENRCRLIDESVVEQLRRRRRHRLKHRLNASDPVRAGEHWMQWLLTEPGRGVVSIAAAPVVAAWRSGLVPYAAGVIPVAVDKSAPSRAFAKLVESEVRLGRRIEPGQTVVDLGACPGSWTYWALGRGARVTAVDRSPLREDLMADARVTFVRGDAFGFRPEVPVDWLVCDVIAAPERSIDLAIRWARERWARQLVVTIKFRGDAEYGVMDRLKVELAPECEEFRLARLCANRNEACVMGVVRGMSGEGTM